jgi:YD repeat-containing protein
MARKKIQLAEVNSLPTVTKGSHLTVTTYPDGRTELEWDDEALLSEVRNAILKAESVMPVTNEVKPAVKAKSKKSVAKSK